jgi:hypothetical protein
LVEGTGETGQIETTNDVFSLGDEYAVTSEPSIVGETDPATGNQYVLEQSFLQNRASNTVSDQNQLYTHFPTGPNSGFSGPNDPDLRDPIEYFNQQLTN